MIAANHEDDHPTEAFIMGEMEKGEAEGIEIPCVMLSYQNVQVWFRLRRV